METIGREFRYALRTLRRSPGVTTVAVRCGTSTAGLDGVLGAVA